MSNPKLPPAVLAELERRCRIAFEGFNDGGAKCYDEDHYTQTFRPQWWAENVKPEHQHACPK